MAFSPFNLRVIARVASLGLTLLLALYIGFRFEWYISMCCLLAIAVAMVAELVHYVKRTHQDMLRFLLAIKHSDFTLRFAVEGAPPQYRELHRLFNEITESFAQVKAEKEVHHQYLQGVVEHLRIGLITFDKTGQIQLMNKAAHRLLDLPFLQNLNAATRLYPNLTEVAFGEPTQEGKLIKLKQLTEEVLLTVQVSILRLQQEEIRIMSFQNIRSEMEAQELEAWKKLISVLTHEIMNSVTPIISLTSSISDLVASELTPVTEAGHLEEDTMEDLQLGLRTIEKRTRGMQHFVENYRRLTRVPPPRRAPLNIQALCSHVCKLVEAQMKDQHIAFLMQLPEEVLWLNADAEQLEQVLLNLLKNAMESCSQVSERRILLRAHKDPKAEHLVRIEVVDNGAGIAPDAQDHVFIPFYTTKPQGSGIGLSLSRQMVRQHGGNLHFTSLPHPQTTFFLTLPLLVEKGRE
ncbi:GHKL domain-containing protein [Nibribacter ruber]|uniref:histidine kinase n=1 Tax=Nibribacter ruber TaxID=2698458 RepID=A0A6P1NYH4_9BACT|nr:ATP-binding protein [Nibribacter ruber]QHL87035.1 GHKL domain-containing protein [Nibribacter ruber]